MTAWYPVYGATTWLVNTKFEFHLCPIALLYEARVVPHVDTWALLVHMIRQSTHSRHTCVDNCRTSPAIPEQHPDTRQRAFHMLDAFTQLRTINML